MNQRQVLTMAVIMLASLPAQADIALVGGIWETSFACDDWLETGKATSPQTCPSDPGCDGINSGVCGDLDLEITQDAAYPGGSGKGLRWELGNGETDQATAQTGSGVIFSWPGSPEIWIRWHVRLPPGLPVSALKDWKLLYAYDPAGDGYNSFYVDTQGGNTSVRLYDRTSSHSGSYGFDDLYGATADGSWHGIEMHFNCATGVFEYWFYKDNVDDPAPKLSTSSVSYRMSTIGVIKFPSNYKSTTIPNPPQDVYFDEVAISTSGRLGPVVAAAAVDSGSPADARSSADGSTIQPTVDARLPADSAAGLGERGQAPVDAGSEAADEQGPGDRLPGKDGCSCQISSPGGLGLFPLLLWLAAGLLRRRLPRASDSVRAPSPLDEAAPPPSLCPSRWSAPR